MLKGPALLPRAVSFATAGRLDGRWQQGGQGEGTCTPVQQRIIVRASLI